MLPGFTRPDTQRTEGDAITFTLEERPLDRILAFAGRSMDDVVNCPFARREVIAVWELHRFVVRQSEVVELERQWNPLARV